MWHTYIFVYIYKTLELEHLVSVPTTIIVFKSIFVLLDHNALCKIFFNRKTSFVCVCVGWMFFSEDFDSEPVDSLYSCDISLEYLWKFLIIRELKRALISSVTSEWVNQLEAYLKGVAFTLYTHMVFTLNIFSENSW